MICDATQLKCASRIVVAVKGLIYSKIYTVSSATNKKYKKGKINNLMNSDTGKIDSFIWQLPHVTCIPFLLMTSSYTLYTFLGHIFWIAVLVIFFSLSIIFYLTKWTYKVNERRRKDEDNRSDCLSEIIDNIRVIKMNSWIN